MEDPTIESALSVDRTSAVLNVRGRFDAGQLESLVCNLGALRSDMEPAVPKDPLQAKFDASLAQLQPNPDLAIVAAPAGVTMILRSQSFGWIGFVLEKAEAAVFIVKLAAALRGDNPETESVPVQISD